MLEHDHRREHAERQEQESDGWNEPAQRCKREAGKSAKQALRAQRPGHPQPKQGVPEEVDGRPTHDDGDLPRGKHLGRMGDHQLVADGRQHDARNEHDMEIRVAVPRQTRAVPGRVLELLLGHRGHVVEVQPPERSR